MALPSGLNSITMVLYVDPGGTLPWAHHIQVYSSPYVGLELHYLCLSYLKRKELHLILYLQMWHCWCAWDAASLHSFCTGTHNSVNFSSLPDKKAREGRGEIICPSSHGRPTLQPKLTPGPVLGCCWQARDIKGHFRNGATYHTGAG